MDCAGDKEISSETLNEIEASDIVPIEIEGELKQEEEIEEEKQTKQTEEEQNEEEQKSEVIDE